MKESLRYLTQILFSVIDLIGGRTRDRTLDLSRVKVIFRPS